MFYYSVASRRPSAGKSPGAAGTSARATCGDCPAGARLRDSASLIFGWSFQVIDNDYVSLFAQAPSRKSFRPGKLVIIDARPEISHYEYTVWNGVDDAFTGASRSPIPVRLNHKVKYAIEGRSLYMIDESGNVHETTCVKQMEMVRTRKQGPQRPAR